MHWKDILKEDSMIKKYFNEADLEELLFSKNKIKHIERIFKEYMNQLEILEQPNIFILFNFLYVVNIILYNSNNIY